MINNNMKNFISLNKRRAFTMTEVVIAGAIFTLILGVFYQIFIAGHKAFNAGTWMANLTQELNVGFRQFQEDIKATAVMVSNVPGDYYKTDAAANPAQGPFSFFYNKKLLTADGVSAGDKIIAFKMCRRPQKKGFESKMENQPALIEQVEFWINEKRELWYEKKSGEWDGDPKQVPKLDPPVDKVVSRRVLIHDVESVRFVPTPPDTKILKEKMFGIEIKLSPKNAGREIKPIIKNTQVLVNVDVCDNLN
jgi:hypothetical protein